MTQRGLLSQRSAAIQPSGKVGKIVRLNVEFVTPAKEAYQAHAAVTRPAQPPALVMSVVVLPVAKAPIVSSTYKPHRQGHEDRCDRARCPQARDRHVKREDRPAEQEEPDHLARAWAAGSCAAK